MRMLLVFLLASVSLIAGPKPRSHGGGPKRTVKVRQNSGKGRTVVRPARSSAPNTSNKTLLGRHHAPSKTISPAPGSPAK
jgi:hypothetical protein